MIAAGRSIQEVADYIGVDSLGYLSLAGLGRAIHFQDVIHQVPTDGDASPFIANEGRGPIHCAHGDEQELKYLHAQFCYGCMDKQGWPFDPIAEAEHGTQHAIFLPRDTVDRRIVRF